MRVLAQNEVQFEVLAERDDVGPDRECSGPVPEEGWSTVTVRAIWWSPRRRPHSADVTVGCLALTDEYNADEVVRERELRHEALEALNEQLREFIVEAHAIGRHLEHPVFEVRAFGVLEGAFPDEAAANDYAKFLRESMGVGIVEVVPRGAQGTRPDLPAPEPQRADLDAEGDPELDP